MYFDKIIQNFKIYLWYQIMRWILIREMLLQKNTYNHVISIFKDFVNIFNSRKNITHVLMVYLQRDTRLELLFWTLINISFTTWADFFNRNLFCTTFTDPIVLIFLDKIVKKIIASIKKQTFQKQNYL